MESKNDDQLTVYVCAWCQQRPRVSVTDEEGTFCQSERCPNYSVGHDGIEIWNQVQRSILAQRRKDFEAGRWIEQGCGLVFTDFEHYMRHAEDLEKYGK